MTITQKYFNTPDGKTIAYAEFSVLINGTRCRIKFTDKEKQNMLARSLGFVIGDISSLNDLDISHTEVV